MRTVTCDVADALIENCADPAQLTVPSVDVPVRRIV
jgi:hypothetical protein